MTAEQCLAAMDRAPLNPALTWEALKAETREPTPSPAPAQRLAPPPE